MKRPDYYALKAFEDNGGPIDHLVSKKQAVNLLQGASILAKQHFYLALKLINSVKLDVIDITPLFASPLDEE